MLCDAFGPRLDAAATRLEVGELARRTGVTVRALHHHDSTGPPRPSGRTEGGCRLHAREDVARLHGIQTLRRMGVPLAEVAQRPGVVQRVLAGGDGLRTGGSLRIMCARTAGGP